jgi:hypothetical protein
MAEAGANVSMAAGQSHVLSICILHGPPSPPAVLAYEIHKNFINPTSCPSAFSFNTLSASR